MGITGGVMMAAHSPVNANEILTNISTEQYLAAKCGGGGSCGGATAYNGRSHGCGASQDPTTFYQPEYYPQNQHGCGGQPTYYQSQSGCSAQNTYYNQSGCNGRGQPNQWGNSNSGQRYYPGYFADNDGQATTTDTDAKPLTETDFKAKLSPQAKADFDKLSPEGKASAIKTASHDCSGKNDCKGQNACKTDKNSCAGQGGCKGQSKCAVTPDQAVKISSLKDKRTSLNNRPSPNNYR